MEDSRPWNLALRVNFCAESDVEFENDVCVHLNLEASENYPTARAVYSTL